MGSSPLFLLLRGFSMSHKPLITGNQKRNVFPLLITAAQDLIIITPSQELSPDNLSRQTPGSSWLKRNSDCLNLGFNNVQAMHINRQVLKHTFSSLQKILLSNASASLWVLFPSISLSSFSVSSVSFPCSTRG